MCMAARTVTFTDFRKNASSILDEVENGAVYRIVRHGRVVAELVTPEARPEKPAWKTKGLRLVTRGAALSDAILDERKTRS
jgi:prevent-host-death family protein